MIKIDKINMILSIFLYKLQKKYITTSIMYICSKINTNKYDRKEVE